MPQNENKRGKKSNWTNVINRLTLYLEFPPFIFFLPSFPWEMEFFQFLVVCVDEISCRNFSIKREKDLGPFTGHSSAQIIKSKLTLTSVSKSNIRHCRRLGRIGASSRTPPTPCRGEEECVMCRITRNTMPLPIPNADVHCHRAES
jgi:hypothetical protein